MWGKKKKKKRQSISATVLRLFKSQKKVIISAPSYYLFQNIPKSLYSGDINVNVTLRNAHNQGVLSFKNISCFHNRYAKFVIRLLFQSRLADITLSLLLFCSYLPILISYVHQLLQSLIFHRVQT